MNPSFTDPRRPLVIPSQTPIPDHPADGPLDHPAARLHHKAQSPGCPPHDLQNQVARGKGPQRQVVPLVGTVGPQQLQTRKTPLGSAQDFFGPVLVLDARRRHRNRDQQPQSVHYHMPLAAGHFLARVVAAVGTALAGLDALAVEDARRGPGFSSFSLAAAGVQDGLDFLPDARFAPTVVLRGHRAPRWEIVGQLAPLAARAQDVEDSIDEAPAVHRPWVADLRAAAVQVWSQQGPLFVRYVTGIGEPLAHTRILRVESICKLPLRKRIHTKTGGKLEDGANRVAIVLGVNRSSESR